jgi:hypothetical protein
MEKVKQKYNIIGANNNYMIYNRNNMAIYYIAKILDDNNIDIKKYNPAYNSLLMATDPHNISDNELIYLKKLLIIKNK